MSVTAVNDIPTLSSFAAVIDTTNEDTEVELTLAELKAQGNEADVDGTVDAFVVKSVTSGTLKIGTSAGTATAWAAGTNDTIDATNHAYWTPDLNANGTQNAFAVVAKDNSGAESTGRKLSVSSDCLKVSRVRSFSCNRSRLNPISEGSEKRTGDQIARTSTACAGAWPGPLER